MADIDALATEIYKDKVRRARLLPPEQKFLDGLQLWEGVLNRMKAGVLLNHPDADGAEQLALVQRQLARLRSIHEHQIYFPCHPEAPSS